MFRQISLVLMAVLFLSQVAIADSIGFVDVQKVFKVYSESGVFNDFEKKQKEAQEKFEYHQKKIADAKSSGKSDDQIQRLIKSMEEELEPQQKALFELNQRLKEKLKRDIITASVAAAKKFGIDVVIDKQAVFHGGFDLTEFVIRDLEADQKTKK